MALAALSAGSKRWKDLDIPAYLRQNQYASSFWMSFHELSSGYPWITKRVARVVYPASEAPPRNGFAYLFAMFLPFAGRMGSGFGVIIMAYIIGVLAAVAIPQYHNYQVKAHTTFAAIATQPIRDTLAEHYLITQSIPTLEQIGVSDSLADGSKISLNPENMIMTVSLKEGELLFVPSIDEQGRVMWKCEGGEGIQPAQLPESLK
jgi:hypothetical protein